MNYSLQFFLRARKKTLRPEGSSNTHDTYTNHWLLCTVHAVCPTDYSFFFLEKTKNFGAVGYCSRDIVDPTPGDTWEYQCKYTHAHTRVHDRTFTSVIAKSRLRVSYWIRRKQRGKKEGKYRVENFVLANMTCMYASGKRENRMKKEWKLKFLWRRLLLNGQVLTGVFCWKCQVVQNFSVRYILYTSFDRCCTQFEW